MSLILCGFGHALVAQVSSILCCNLHTLDQCLSANVLLPLLAALLPSGTSQMPTVGQLWPRFQETQCRAATVPASSVSDL